MTPPPPSSMVGMVLFSLQWAMPFFQSQILKSSSLAPSDHKTFSSNVWGDISQDLMVSLEGKSSIFQHYFLGLKDRTQPHPSSQNNRTSVVTRRAVSGDLTCFAVIHGWLELPLGAATQCTSQEMSNSFNLYLYMNLVLITAQQPHSQLRWLAGDSHLNQLLRGQLL